MGIMQRALKSLLPDGQPWRLPTTTRQVIEALGTSLDRVKSFVDSIRDESLPSSAVDTLVEWYRMLDTPYDATQALSDRRARAKQQWTARGGQSLNYLNGILQIAYPDVEIRTIKFFYESVTGAGEGEAGRMFAASYPTWISPTPTDGSFPWAFYEVFGEVENTTDLNGLLGILDRIAPAEMQPTLNVTVINLTPAAEAGLGMAGLMEAGRELA